MNPFLVILIALYVCFYNAKAEVLATLSFNGEIANTEGDMSDQVRFDLGYEIENQDGMFEIKLFSGLILDSSHSGQTFESIENDPEFAPFAEILTNNEDNLIFRQFDLLLQGVSSGGFSRTSSLESSFFAEALMNSTTNDFVGNTITSIQLKVDSILFDDTGDNPNSQGGTLFQINLTLTINGEPDPNIVMISLKKDWNLVSVPKELDNKTVEAVFGDSIRSPAWFWNQGKFGIATLISSKLGYYVNAPENIDLFIPVQ